MSESETEKKKKIVKVFVSLNREIIKTELCCACGACVAYCDSQDFNVIKMENFIPQYKSNETKRNCTLCGICYSICPQTNTLEEELNESLMIEDGIGRITNLLVAKTTNDSIKGVGQDGGIVTTALEYLFDKDIIDAAIVSIYDKDLKPTPKIIFNKEDLIKSAGTRYSVSSQILPLKNLYRIPQDIQKEKEIHDIDQLKIAFVGTPCQAKAIRKMQYLNIKPAHVVKYIIGLFCFENFHYEKLYELLEKETNVKPSNMKRTFIDKKFFVHTDDNKEFEVVLKNLDPAVRKNCLNCEDFTAKYSDISVGSVGAPKGYSMIVIRNEKGQELIDNLLKYNYIEQSSIPIEDSKEWMEKKKSLFKRMISIKKKK